MTKNILKKIVRRQVDCITISVDKLRTKIEQPIRNIFL